METRKRKLLLTLALLGAYSVMRAESASAQATNQHASAQNHNHQAVTLIKGEEHPEKISDAIAYGLYFGTVSLSPKHTPQQETLQAAQLAQIGLDSTDLQVLKGNLASFRVAFDELVTVQNKEATSGQPDMKLFNLRKDALVVRTREAISSAMSQHGSAQFNAYVQGEKRRMIITASEVTQ